MAFIPKSRDRAATRQGALIARVSRFFTLERPQTPDPLLPRRQAACAPKDIEGLLLFKMISGARHVKPDTATLVILLVATPSGKGGSGGKATPAAAASSAEPVRHRSSKVRNGSCAIRCISSPGTFLCITAHVIYVQLVRAQKDP
jgi:hypothetical protein